MTKISIILGEFHKNKMELMLEKAQAAALELNLEINDVIWVPGSMEKPLVIKKQLETGKDDGLVVLGIIERGETKHGLIMADAVIHAIIQLQLEYGIPIGVGIIGPEVFPSQIDSRLEAYAEKAVEAVKQVLDLSIG